MLFYAYGLLGQGKWNKRVYAWDFWFLFCSQQHNVTMYVILFFKCYEYIMISDEYNWQGSKIYSKLYVILTTFKFNYVSICLSPSLSLSPTHTNTYTLSLSHTHTLTLSLSISCFLISDKYKKVKLTNTFNSMKKNTLYISDVAF